MAISAPFPAQNFSVCASFLILVASSLCLGGGHAAFLHGVTTAARTRFSIRDDDTNRNRSFSTCFASSPKSKNSEFLLQELRAQCQAIYQNKVPPKQINSLQQKELQGYAQQILLQQSGPEKLVSLEAPQSWTLVLLGTNTLYEDLPFPATVVMKLLDQQQAVYGLDFFQNQKVDFQLALGGMYEMSAPDSNTPFPLLQITFDGSLKVDAWGWLSLTLPLGFLFANRQTAVSIAFKNEWLWIDDQANVYFNTTDE